MPKRNIACITPFSFVHFNLLPYICSDASEDQGWILKILDIRDRCSPGCPWSLHTGGGAGTLGHGAIQMWLQRRCGLTMDGPEECRHYHKWSRHHTPPLLLIAAAALWTRSVRMWNIFVTGKLNLVCGRKSCWSCVACPQSGTDY